MTERTQQPQICVGAVTIDQDRLLLIRRATAPQAGYWSLPGGRVEFGETMAEALVREVREETGVDVICGDVVDWIELINDDDQNAHHFVIVDYRAMVMGNADPTSGSDAAEAVWVELDDVAELNLVDGLAEFLSEHGFIRLLA